MLCFQVYVLNSNGISCYILVQNQWSPDWFTLEVTFFAAGKSIWCRCWRHRQRYMNCKQLVCVSACVKNSVHGGCTHSPGKTPPLGRDPPDTALGRPPLDAHTHPVHARPRRPLQWTIRILLECILVFRNENMSESARICYIWFNWKHTMQEHQLYLTFSRVLQVYDWGFYHDGLWKNIIGSIHKHPIHWIQ